jgi:hypothetical protein
MKALIRLVAAAAIVISALVIAAEPDPELESLLQVSDKLMAEEYRRSVKKIVVLPGVSPESGAVTGSYRKETDGLIDGVDRGREIGVFRKDIGGIPISFPIPILTIPGMIFGGLSGTIKREIQDFRDAMTENLAESAGTPLTNDALATDVFWRLRDVSGLQPKVFALTTPIPEDTDAILYVSFSDASIEVDGKVATIIFTATATLRRHPDGQHLYENQIYYQDSDTLGNWTENEAAAWRDYANYARHYMGREIVAELFERVEVQQGLRPEETNTVSRVKKKEWQAVTASQTPTLAWDLELAGNDQQLPWAKTINEADISYDLEIYDKHQLIYSARNVVGQQHTVEVELEDCKTYRWTVRPSYPVDGAIRFGEWMRSNPDTANGNAGTAGSEVAAYIHDFASLQVKCGRR